LKTEIISALLFCIVLTSCVKKYKFTSKVCDKILFVENFNVNPFGVAASYLTDSVNFRKYIRRWDEDHETYRFYCKDDNVLIMKTVEGNRWAQWDTAANGMISLKSNLDTIQNLTFSISQLKKLDNIK
jgi:hypothetical protein